MPDYFEELKEFAMRASPLANAALRESEPGLKPASDFESEWVLGMPGKGGVQPRPSYSVGPTGEDILAREIRTLPEFEAPPGAFRSTEVVDPEELEALRRKIANYAEKYGRYDPKDVSRLAELEAMEGNTRSIRKIKKVEYPELPERMRDLSHEQRDAFKWQDPDERWVSIEKAAPRQEGEGFRRWKRIERMEPYEPMERISPMVRPGVDALESLMNSFGFSDREIPEGTRVEKVSVEKIPSGDDLLSASMPKRY